jgi:hypothetical protein
MSEDDIFDILTKAHVVDTGHSGYRITYENLKLNYANISRETCKKFTDFCICSVNTPMPSRMEGIKPILSKVFNDRGQVHFYINHFCFQT